MQTFASRAIELYRTSVSSLDIDAFMSLYDPKATIFDMWGTWMYEGTDAWRLAVREWFSSVGEDKLEVTFQDVRTSRGGNLALLTAIVKYRRVSRVNRSAQQMENRITWSLKVNGQVARIIHEHTSAPIGPGDMKAIFQRPDSRGPAEWLSIG